MALDGKTGVSSLGLGSPVQEGCDLGMGCSSRVLLCGRSQHTLRTTSAPYPSSNIVIFVACKKKTK